MERDLIQETQDTINDLKEIQECVTVIRDELNRKDIIIDNLVQYIYDNCSFKGLFYEFLQREFGFSESEAVYIIDRMISRDE